MAEEQFTSRRARREAERVAAEQAFEAREAPEQPSEPSSNDRAELLNPPPAPTEATASPAQALDPSPRPPETSAPESESQTAAPKPWLSSDEAAPAETTDSVDPQRAPLPHFDSRTGRKNYLREHGLSPKGDVSTGATPIIAGPEVTSPEGSDAASSDDDESFDTAGFGGSADEVAARDFESPVTAASAPRPSAVDNAPHDALSQPIEELGPRAAPTGPDSGSAKTPAGDYSLSPGPRQPVAETAESAHASSERSGDALREDTGDEQDATSRSRRMPIVQPPSSSGVRVVTAASAQIPVTDSPEPNTDLPTDKHAPGRNHSGGGSSAATAPTHDSSASDLNSRRSPDSAGGTEASSDDAARALAANPETRPMETVPEAWALPNSDYEDEETENPPGTRIRASEVTGHDGRILVGEEPSKVPYVVLGVAALFAVALIVIALVMLL